MNPSAKEGASGAWTEWGPPERMMTRGERSVMAESGEVPEMQRDKTERERIRLVMRCVYWEPKSKMRTRSDFTSCASMADYRRRKSEIENRGLCRVSYFASDKLLYQTHSLGRNTIKSSQNFKPFLGIPYTTRYGYKDAKDTYKFESHLINKTAEFLQEEAHKDDIIITVSFKESWESSEEVKKLMVARRFGISYMMENVYVMASDTSPCEVYLGSEKETEVRNLDCGCLCPKLGPQILIIVVRNPDCAKNNHTSKTAV
ncbi:hypothetical protein V2J09_008942 [Rumex salicifolius]